LPTRLGCCRSNSKVGYLMVVQIVLHAWHGMAWGEGVRLDVGKLAQGIISAQRRQRRGRFAVGQGRRPRARERCSQLSSPATSGLDTNLGRFHVCAWGVTRPLLTQEPGGETWFVCLIYRHSPVPKGRLLQLSRGIHTYIHTR
jgi:hypothetical protein